MGRHANQAIWEQFHPDLDLETEDQPPPENDWDADFSDWKHNRDDDLATAVRRYAVPVTRVRLFDEVETGR